MSRPRRGMWTMITLAVLTMGVMFAQSYAWPDDISPWLELTGRFVFIVYWSAQIARPYAEAMKDVWGEEE